MPELYPLLLQPEFYARPWGARSLAPIYPEVKVTEPIGEAWLTGDKCKVANGPLAGKTLAELAKEFGRDLVGATAPQPDRFPLLIKFLFPCEKLSVQVHPDDHGAKQLGEPCGKTECWYVLSADPGAKVGLGLRPGVTKQEFAQAIRETRAEELLNWIDIHAGELIYVDAGTVHAIGPGSILVETQQNSDTTFRLYDYGRPRELHIEQGLAATKERTLAGKVERQRHAGRAESAHVETLISAGCFVVEKYAVRELLHFSTLGEGGRLMQVLVAVSGGGVVEGLAGTDIAFTRGEAVVVPAAVDTYRVRPQWELEFLRSLVPMAHVADPAVAF